MRLQIGKIWLIVIIGIATASEAKAQVVSSNPLEWMALAEGNELINSEIEKANKRLYAKGSKLIELASL